MGGRQSGPKTNHPPFLPLGGTNDLRTFKHPRSSLARFGGDLTYRYQYSHLKKEKNVIMLFASGLVLGEAFLSLC
jgi:hypothetical protein